MMANYVNSNNHPTSTETDALVVQRRESTFRQRFQKYEMKQKWLWVAAGLVVFVGMLETFRGSVSSSTESTAAADVDSPMFPLFGSSKHSKKNKKKDDNDTHHSCTDGRYSKRTFKLAYELPFAALFVNNKGEKKYEASDVIIDRDGKTAYAVCDSSWAISKFSTQLRPFSPANMQVGDPHREKEDSDYEALFEEDGVLYVIRESVLHEDQTYHAIVEELEQVQEAADDENYNIRQSCKCGFEFEGDSKGFEGAVAVHDLNGEMVILGLCEGNHCSETNKNDRGNGRVVVMKKITTTQELADATNTSNTSNTTSCVWSTVRQIHIPKSAYFKDYSAIALNEETGRVIIASQEESQAWIGHLLGKMDNGRWDVNSMEFSSEHNDRHTIYDFPKNDRCETIYCNIEGVHWINDEMIMTVSDKMKSRGKQDYRCFDKDQSVQVFVLPK